MVQLIPLIPWSIRYLQYHGPFNTFNTWSIQYLQYHGPFNTFNTWFIQYLQYHGPFNTFNTMVHSIPSIHGPFNTFNTMWPIQCLQYHGPFNAFNTMVHLIPSIPGPFNTFNTWSIQYLRYHVVHSIPSIHGSYNTFKTITWFFTSILSTPLCATPIGSNKTAWINNIFYYVNYNRCIIYENILLYFWFNYFVYFSTRVSFNKVYEKNYEKNEKTELYIYITLFFINYTTIIINIVKHIVIRLFCWNQWGLHIMELRV